MTKTCIECFETKPITDFHKSSKQGYRAKCKACLKDSASEYQTTKNMSGKSTDWSYLKQLAKRHKYRGIE